ncbi:hypothetical protein BH09ACT7_BH09ACT7_30620 [soil metagenome]
MPVDWFETLTGFREGDYQTTRARLRVEGTELMSSANEKRYEIGQLTLLKLADLRARASLPDIRRSTVGNLVGDARALHSEPEFAGATVQVASQFNVLELAAPSVTPGDGVGTLRPIGVGSRL